jgi:hypothetical protein
MLSNAKGRAVGFLHLYDLREQDFSQKPVDQVCTALRAQNT